MRISLREAGDAIALAYYGNWGRRLAAVVVLAVLAGGLAVAGMQDAGAAAPNNCTPNPCVMVMQVAGLEAEDVDQTTTPFLWSLAHPVDTGTDDRNGWIWQAPRAVMGAGIAPNTAALLTGGYAEQSGVPGDEFIGPEAGHVRLRPDSGDHDPPPGDKDNNEPISDGQLSVDTIHTLMDNSDDANKTAAFIGDPALAPLAGAVPGGQADLSWTPAEGSSSSSDPFNPAFCEVPRDPFTPLNLQQTTCPANDEVTLNKAFTNLQSGGQDVVFTHIYLAALGAIKRRTADLTDAFKAPDIEGLDDAQAQQLEEQLAEAATVRRDALAQTDAAIEEFVGRMQADATGGMGDAWKHTVLFVVGDNGYELSPLSHRVPNPHPSDQVDASLQDLTDYQGNGIVDNPVDNKSIEIVPQGTMATVYLKDKDNRDTKLKSLKQAIESVNTTPGGRCQQLSPGVGCVKEVLYVQPNPADLDPPPGSPEPKKTVAAAHPSWHLDPVDPNKCTGSAEDVASIKNCQRTGSGGDLVVVTEPTWAVGRAVALPPVQTGVPNPGVTNANLASAGGPRNRAVAALVNGPKDVVKQVEATQSDGRYPVSADPAGDRPTNPSPAPFHPTMAAANRDPVDDANADGHKLQPETVDFLPTIAALLRISGVTPNNVAGGRFLQEGFVEDLNLFKEEEDIGEGLPDEPELPPPPPIRSKPPKGFTFKGLFRHGRARVVDAGGRPIKCPKEKKSKGKKSAKKKPKKQDPNKCTPAKKGALLDSIKVEGDFGKPVSLVQLTFYRKQSGKGGKRRLRAIAKFDPFTLKRGPVKMTLKVPPLFKPTYIGIVVYEARKIGMAACKKKAEQLRANALKLGKRPPTAVPCYEPKGKNRGGDILDIKDGTRLHTRK